MERWTHRMIRLRWAVVAVWAVILVGSVGAMSGLSDLLTNRFSLPGTDTERAENVLEEHFGQKTTGSFSLIVKGEPGSARAWFPRYGGRRRGQLERCRPPRSPPSRPSPTTSSRRRSSPTWSLRTRRGTPTT